MGKKLNSRQSSEGIDTPNERSEAPDCSGITQGLPHGLQQCEIQPINKLPPAKQDRVSEEAAASGRGAERRWAYRNVVGVGFSVFFVFTAFLGLQNLQSSINSDQGLGLTSLAVLYVFFTLFGFFSPSVLKILGTKYSLSVSLLCYLLFIVANFYPSWYTLVPAAVVAGIGSALLWASANSHIVEVAVLVAPKLGVDSSHLIGTFTGILFCFFQFSSVPGNLASSLILFPYNGLNRTVSEGDENQNSSSVGSCQSSTGQEFNVQYLYILCSMYSLSVFVAILFSVTMVTHLGTDKAFFSNTQKFQFFFKAPLIELLKVIKSYKMILIAPISIFNGLEQSFAFGSFTALVAICFGTFQVGFTLISFGVTSALLSVVYGKAVKYIPMLCIFFFGGVINVALLLFLLLWTPTPSYLAIFSFAVLWGAADGVWNTMTTSLTGILFPTRVQSAYSAQRIWLAIGFTVGFIIAEVLDLHSRIWVMLAAVILALCSVLALEMSTQFRCPCSNPAHSYSVNRVSVNYDKSSSATAEALTKK